MRWRLPKTPSLALRLSIAFSLSIFIVAAVYLSVQMVLAKRFAGFVTQQSLMGQTHDIAEAIVLDASGGPVDVRLGAKDAFGFDAFFANLKYRVLTGDGQVVASSDGRLDSLLPAVRVDQQDGFYTPTVIDGVKFHVAAVRHRVGGQAFVVQVGRSDRFADLAQEAIAPAVTEAVSIIAGMSILVLAVLSYFGIRSVLRPIRRVSEAARNVGKDNLSTRLPPQDVPSEIRPLIIAFNDVLDRLEVAFSTQQRFFANAAHELKTPIALLRGQLETGSAGVSADTLRDIDALGRTVNQLLHIAEVSGGRPLERRKVAVDEVARQVAGFLSWRAERAEVSIQVSATQARAEVTADPGELFVLLKNLVENAIDHSPRGGVVLVSPTSEHLEVEDRGPGVPDAYRDKVFERFWRAPDNTRSGSGLGLAICVEVAQAHGWHIQCDRAASGGALFRVVFGARPDGPAARPGAESRQ